MSVAGTPHDLRTDRLKIVRTALAATLGAGIVAVAFHPLSTTADLLDVAAHPWRVAAMPSTLLAGLAVAAAIAFPRQDAPLPSWPLVVAVVLLGVGGTLSIAGSSDPANSAVTTVLAIFVPAVVAAALLRADLPSEALTAGFLAATCAFMLRAAVVFVENWGLPTPGALFEAKFSIIPYDFHYYTLGNPDHTAGFLLLPLAVSAFWALHPGLSRLRRALLILAAGICLASLVLTYSRSALFAATVVVVAASVASPLPRWLRVVVVAAAASVFLGWAIAGGGYVFGLFSTGEGASGRERLLSLEDGLGALAHQPLTGVGLGQYGPAGGYFNAHSSVIQAGAEMGLAGFWALLLLTGGLVSQGRATVRRAGRRGLGAGAGIAVALYGVYAVLAAPANEGLYSGYITIWAMTLAMLVAICLVHAEPAVVTCEAVRTPAGKTPPEATETVPEAPPAGRAAVAEQPRIRDGR